MYLKQEHPPSVSASEIAVWKQCRQKWYWQYFLRVEPSVTHTKLAQGTMAHAGIAAALGGANVEQAVAKSAFDLDRDIPIEIDGELVGGMGTANDEIASVSSCVEKWDRESNLRERKLISSEVKWEVPARDGKRQMPGVTWNGRMDALLTIGGYGDEPWGLEAKFVGQFRSEESVELSSQLAMYLLFMREQTANPKLIYLQILNKVPAVPNVNKTGGISRSPINTDWDTYRAAIVANGYYPEDYADIRERLSGKRFWTEQVVTRPEARLAEERSALYDVSVEIMAKRKRVYMCDSPFLCKSCQFRDLCLETVRGRDPLELIESGAYVSRDKPNEDAEVATDEN
jgi:hypothetical protein